MAAEYGLRAVIIGCGTIGAATGAALASVGVKVALYDISAERRAALSGGGFGEAGMARAMRQAMDDGRLRVIERLRRQVEETCFIVCVPTPVDGSGALESGALDQAMAAIAGVARDDDAVLIRSTVPIGMTRRLAGEMRGCGLTLRFASAPDRSIEGRSFADQFSVPQLIGGVDKAAADQARALFAPLGQVIDLGCAEAAEAAKLFANAWRATMFAASNAMAMVCETHGLDVHTIFAGASENYARFSPPRPGPVGGPCLPKDVKLLAAGVPPAASVLMRSVIESEAQFLVLVLAALDAHLATRAAGARVALLGVAFKGRPEVDDVRGSIALALAQHLRARWPEAMLVGWDAAMSTGQVQAAGLAAAARVWEAADDADLVVLCNNHPALADIDIEKLAGVLGAGALIYDVAGVTQPCCRALPNAVRHHILGQGLPGGRINVHAAASQFGHAGDPDVPKTQHPGVDAALPG